MKILVTGGEGFLGSHVVDALARMGHEVIAIDHHAREKVRFPNPNAKLYITRFGHGDVEQILRDEAPDAVIHLAAQISVTRSIKDPIHDAQMNIVDAVKFFEWAKKAGVKRFVFASSGGAIYGDHPVRPTPILTDPEPLSPYGVGKFGFEKYMAGRTMGGGMSAVALRFSNFYGPRQQMAKGSGEGNVVTLFLHRMLVSGEPITIFGDGSASRDYVFVEDAVGAILRAVESDITGPVNIGTGTAVSVRELAEELSRIHGKPHDISFEPYRSGEVFHSVIDASSAFERLGWRATTTLQEGLKKTYDWYRDTFGM